MAKQYGLPYQGSKSKLADKIVDLLPPAKHLYSPFAGGCAVEHCALLSGKYECVHFSDINDSVVLFRDCLEGNIPDGSEWISREEFFRRRDTDPYVRIIWSFSNNQRDYLYSREVEPYKKAVHEMLYAPTPNERRLKFKDVCRLIESIKCRPFDVESAEKAVRLNSIRLENGRHVIPERIGRLAWISSLKATSINEDGVSPRYVMNVADYRDIDILPDSVIYCDIPYKDTRNYRRDTFDHGAFYQWALQQTSPIFISEYSMPSDFECVAEFERVSTFSATNNALKKVERIYRPKTQL